MHGEENIVRKHSVVALLSTTVAVAAIGLLAPTGTALASGRPGGPPVATSGVGTLGSPWKLKSMHDDVNGAQVVGEEFEIAAPAGDVWQTTFADNGHVFFQGSQLSTAAGIREVHMTANQAGTQRMSVHSVDSRTGETVDGSVALPPL
jgi:hypothetical protein